MVDGVDVRHAVCDDAADFFETAVGAHGADGVALDEDVALGQQFQRFQGTAIRP